MTIQTQRITLDLSKDLLPPTIFLGQGDSNGTTVEVEVEDGGNPVALASFDVRLCVGLPKRGGSYEVMGTKSGNVASFDVDETYAAAVPGRSGFAYVQLLQGDDVICSTSRATVIVERSHTDGVDPTTAYDAGVATFLAQADAQLSQAIDSASESAAAAQATAIAAKVPYPTPAAARDGEDGQVLVSNGDGTTRWGDGVGNGSITTPRLADGAVTGAKMAQDAVSDAVIAEGGVGTVSIANGAVTPAKLADGAVTTPKLADGAVTTAKLGDSAVDTDNVADLSITTPKLANGAVTSGKIAEGGVKTANIDDGAVVEEKLEDGAVAREKLAVGAVGTLELGDSSVTTAKLAANSIATNKLKDGAVTDDKLDQFGVLANVTRLQAQLDNLDVTVDPDDFALEQDPDTGMVYIVYRGERSENGIPLSGGGGGQGGGSGNNASMSVSNASGWLSRAISEGQSCPITLEWSSTEDGIPTGGGSLTVTVGNVQRLAKDVEQGTVTLDLGPMLSTGQNRAKVRIADVYGNARTLTFSVNVVKLSLGSNFDNSSTFPAGQAVEFTYVPTGAIEKTVHFQVDGTELPTETVTASGRQQSKQLPAMQHGSHSLACWFTAEIDGQEVSSNTIRYDLVVVDPTSLAPVIASPFAETRAVQYQTLVIPYTVYTPNSLSSEVTLSAHGKQVAALTVDRSQQAWSYRCDGTGQLTLTIRSGTATKSFTLQVEASEIDAHAETEALALHLTAYGRSNAEAHPETWEDSENGVQCTLTGFNFESDGWQTDADGATALRVSNDARVAIPYTAFAGDFRSTGKTIEVEFATHDVLDYDAVIMSCMSGGRGFQLTSQLCRLASEQREISMQYKEDEHVRVSFVVEKRAEDRLMLVYINGIVSGAVQYPADDDFSQQEPVGITIGSSDCAVDVYCIRVYDNDLTRYQVLDNWIADTQGVTEMLARYSRNEVYDAYGAVTVDKLPGDLPYFILEAEELPQYKGDKKTISGRYVDPLSSARSFSFEGCQINVQGTSSAPYARKNYDMQFKGGFDLQTGHADMYELADGIVPFNRFVLKADVASSESANNVELVKLFCDADPYKRPEELEDPRVRKGIYGFPIVVFWHDTASGNTTLLGKYNFNLPKRAPGPYGYDGDMESWEFQNNTSNLMLFKTDVFDNTMVPDPDSGDLKEAWRYDYEARFPSDEWTDYSKLQELQSFVVSCDRSKATGDALPSPVTYGGTEYASDTADYRLAKFRAEFGNYAEVDSFVFYYIFTELFLMVDSRAKNLFIGFSGGDADGLAAIDRKAVAEPYDMDTAIGTNNEGSLVFGYSLEDTDRLAGADVFNGQESVLWCNVRDAFPSEITNMYQDLRSRGVLSYDSVVRRFEEHQAKWPEAVFNEDAWYKYLDPLIAPDAGKQPTAVYLPMLQGSKAEQRKWWLYNRFRYMDSKWNAGDALVDVVQLRGYAKADITVTPYADIYPTVKYGSYTVGQRGTHGQPTTLPCPLDNVNDTEIYVYSAPQIESLGDLSGLKVGFADFSKATRLQAIKVGDGASGYSNPNLTELHVGTNPLLREVDARNCPNLVGTVDLSGAANVERVRMAGTSVTSVSLPVGGILKELELPATVANLTVRGQRQLASFSLGGGDYSSVTTLRVENTSGIPVLDVMADMADGGRVRIVGLELTVSTTDDVEDFFDSLDRMRGLDENGGNLDRAVVAGNMTGLGTVDGSWYAEQQARYPEMRIGYEHISSTLNYYNYDGSSLLHAETVNDGGDGTWNGTSTRSSTAQYSYAFAGWNLDKDKYQADPNAVKDVVGDRDVYAAFTRTVRTYTVTWKNADNTVLETDTGVAYGSTPHYDGATPTYQGETAQGWTPAIATVTGDATYTASYTPVYQVRFYNGSTLLQTSSVKQGGTASYTGSTPVDPDGEGKEFIGWDKPLTNIQQATDFYAQYKPLETISDTWGQIIAAVEDGTYKTKYSVGDTKTLDLGTEGQIPMKIAAFDADPRSDGAGNAEITWVATKALKTEHRANRSQEYNHYGTGSQGGWSESEMRSYLRSTVFPLIPSEVAAAIKPVSKYSRITDNLGSLVDNKKSDDTIWIPSAREIGVDATIESNCPQYSDAFPNDASRVMSAVGESSASPWWLRSAYDKSQWYCITEAGAGGHHYSYNAKGMVIGFCIGNSRPVEIQDSWDDIIANVNNGTAASKYSVGSYKPLDLGTEGVVNMQIVGKGVDPLADGTGNAALSFVGMELLNTEHRMNPSKVAGTEGTGTLGGWDKSEMRSYLQTTILPLVPSNVAAAIKPVTKYSRIFDVSETTVNNSPTTDSLWIPSAHEVGISGTETNGPSYSEMFPRNDAERRVKSVVGASSTSSWWLRSANTARNFTIIDANGASYDMLSDGATGVALGFCI